MNFTIQEDDGHSGEPFRECFELNQNKLGAQGLSKWCNTRITEPNYLENLGDDKENDQKGNICMLPILLQLPLLLLPDQSIYSIEGKFELNRKTLCDANSQNSVSSELIWVLS